MVVVGWVLIVATAVALAAQAAACVAAAPVAARALLAPPPAAAAAVALLAGEARVAAVGEFATGWLSQCCSASGVQAQWCSWGLGWRPYW